MNYVQPAVYLTGITSADYNGLVAYLKATNNEEFLTDVAQAQEAGISGGEILCSFYAKLCYKSLTVGKNLNISRTRDIASNLEGCFDHGHGSVFEHCLLNFVITDCSRVLTHELVRHRVGTAFSQTSGRYVATDEIDFVMDPILSPVEDDITEVLEYLERKTAEMREKLDVDGQKFDVKKKLTSAIRRIMPNGQGNEIGFSTNIRNLRHTLVMRTSVHAEWEIRSVFNQIAAIVEGRWPLMLYGIKKEDTGDGMFEYTLS